MTLTTKDIDERFKRVEGYVDVAYDVSMGALDSVFTFVDALIDKARKRAIESVSRTAPVKKENTLEDKVKAIIKWAKDNHRTRVASLMNKQWQSGMYDVYVIEKLWKGLPDEYK